VLSIAIFMRQETGDGDWKLVNTIGVVSYGEMDWVAWYYY